ncbi:Histidine kinase-like ATPase domain-containing protein [Ectothiorhodospira magna]|uniref:Histidine kinase-like ATPase domain-containing protein n=1 Tax=Ectothiorhodospira magna TaxID=867345 RepID=A0A1H9A6M0_9GAMM|nr:fused response regulator/phosphatase [Ectothiorhodospira magna]SEP72382.1 Histidine kinase-like ATPase domain-containing protein [Ectothiorhodospira magna]
MTNSEGMGGEPPSAVPATPGSRGMALVVDDESSNRRLLGAMLKREGFAVTEAENGHRALELFEQSPPDIVFMDVMMPGMDGFEATRRIKTLSGMDFVPVIFLTALHDDQSLIRCIEVGGDDSLSKPFSFNILKARIVAMERVRDLHRSIAAKSRQLAQLVEMDRQEQKLAERIFSYAVNDRNVALEQLILLQRPATTFNGDLFLSQYLPDGSLRVLLGDFTGHGLAAAIGALPVSDVFHVMTRKGVGDEAVLDEINRKLYRVLPPDRFMCAFMVTFPVGGGGMIWWNGGMPDGLICQANGVERLASHALPLGILPELSPGDAPRRRSMGVGDRLVLMSDGLIEARDDNDRMFGEAVWPGLIDGWRHGSGLMEALCQALDDHCGDAEQQDDIGAVEIPMMPGLFGLPHAEDMAHQDDSCAFSLILRDDRLAPIPCLSGLLCPLGLMDVLKAHKGPLQTILHELYSNALDHGILQLPSWMKATPEGFSAYYNERERRIAAGISGSIRVDLSYEPGTQVDRVRMTITDSGQGFDVDRPRDALDASVKPWGRGIALVRELCESVTYSHQGTQVEAVYLINRAMSSSPPA